MGKMTCTHDIWHPHPHWVWTLAKLAICPTLSNKENIHKNIHKKNIWTVFTITQRCQIETCPLGTQSLHNLHIFCQILRFSKRCTKNYRFFRIRIPFTTRCRPARTAQLVVFRPVAELLQCGVKDHDIPRSHYMTPTQGFWPPNEGKWDTLPETNQMRLKIGRAPKEKLKFSYLHWFSGASF